MVDSSYCLDQVVPEGISQVWRRSEVGNHKRRTFNTRLFSGTSENTSSSSRNVPGRMIRYDLFWYRNNAKMKPTYRGKNFPDYFFGGFRSTLKTQVTDSCALSFWEGVLGGPLLSDPVTPTSTWPSSKLRKTIPNAFRASSGCMI